MDVAITFVSDEEADTIVICDLVLDDFGSTVLEDHDAIAFVLGDRVP
jgi:hypothetical protein